METLYFYFTLLYFTMDFLLSSKNNLFKYKKVNFIGRLPAENEVGGVTSFAHSISINHPNFIKNFIDIYPTKNKKIHPNSDVNVIEIKGNAIVRLLKIFIINMKENNVLFHYNFSDLSNVYILLIFPKRKNTKWLFVFHHGVLDKSYEKFSFLKKILTRIALSRSNINGVISNKQKKFLKQISEVPIYNVLPFVESNDKNTFTNNFKHRKETLFLISGFPTHIYRHIEVLNVIEELYKTNLNIRLDLCLYGADTDGLLQTIINKAKSLSFVNTFQHLENNSFLSKLSEADIYIRMNSIDSFGITVAEAAQLGVKVFASDVCSRYPGTYIIPKDDFILLKKALSDYIRNSTPPNYLPIAPAYSNIISWDVLYTLLLDEYFFKN